MSKLPSREVRAARWIEFAEFMEGLKEEKFNHNTWCRPDHTCKTFACVAGWGAINYTEEAKNWLEATFEYQKIMNKDYEKRTEEEKDKYNELYWKSQTTKPNSEKWIVLGSQGLYLNPNTAKVLFLPDNFFWHCRGPITAKDIALIFRYMATFHGRLGRRFDRERMQKVIDQYKTV